MKLAWTPLRIMVAAWLALHAGMAAAQEPAAPSADSGPPEISPKDAERLFLSYINDRKSLIRSCMFLGGVRIEEISGTGDRATVQIRYRIECTQEEITMPPLTRTMRENFVYRHLGDHWEILGRAAELPPESVGNVPAASISPPAAAPADPLDQDRAALAEQILAWAVQGKAPEGVSKPFPGATDLTWKSPVLVSEENLGGVADLSVPRLKVIVLGADALLQRTVVENGGVWFHFEVMELHGDSARVRVSLVSPVLPSPRPGEALTRVLSRVDIDFRRGERSWILTRFRVAG